MFNSIIVATVRPFANGTPDKNGLEPKILNILGGKCPNRTVLSGTIADSLGLKDNCSYMLQVRETETSDKYGRQFQYTVVKELGAMEIIHSVKELGNAQIFSVDGTSVPKPSVVLEEVDEI